MANEYQFAIPKMSLKFAEFNPAQYKPETADPRILPHSMELWKASNQAANNGLSAISQTMNKLRPFLNPQEYAWYDKLSDDAINRIQDEIQFGNLGSATAFAQEEAIKILNNRELQDKVAYQDAREKELTRIKNRADINDDAKKAAQLLNPYNFNGNPVYKLNFDPSASMGVDEIARRIAAVTPEYSKTTGNTTTNNISLDKEGNITDDVNKIYYKKGASSIGGTHTYQTKEAERLEKNFWNTINGNSQIGAAIQQNYQVAKILYEDAYKRMNDESLSEFDREQAAVEYYRHRHEITDKDGLVIKNLEDYINKKVLPLVKAQAYRNTSNITKNETSIDDDIYTKNRGKVDEEVLTIEDVEEPETSNPVERDYNSTSYATTLPNYQDAVQSVLDPIRNFLGSQQTVNNHNEATNDASLFEID